MIICNCNRLPFSFKLVVCQFLTEVILYTISIFSPTNYLLMISSLPVESFYISCSFKNSLVKYIGRPDNLLAKWFSCWTLTIGVFRGHPFKRLCWLRYFLDWITLRSCLAVKYAFHGHVYIFFIIILLMFRWFHVEAIQCCAEKLFVDILVILLDHDSFLLDFSACKSKQQGHSRHSRISPSCSESQITLVS